MTDFAAYQGTRPVAEAHRFDVAALERYMRDHVAGFPSGGSLQVEQFKGGQSNPTFLLRADKKSYVLRRKPPGKLLPSAHAVDREYRVITALAATDVPVARTHALCTDEAVIGAVFYIMEYVEGRVLWDPKLPGMDPAERGAIFEATNRVIAALHRVDYAAIGLAGFGKPGNYFQRQIDRWSRQYKASETEKIEADGPADRMAAGQHSRGRRHHHRARRLPHRQHGLPSHASRACSRCSTGSSRRSAIRMADFSYHMMAWRLSAAEFRGLRGADLAALGIPSRRRIPRALSRAHRRPRARRQDWELLHGVQHVPRRCDLPGRDGAGGGWQRGERAGGGDGTARAPAWRELGWKQVEQLEARLTKEPRWISTIPRK